MCEWLPKTLASTGPGALKSGSCHKLSTEHLPLPIPGCSHTTVLPYTDQASSPPGGYTTRSHCMGEAWRKGAGNKHGPDSRALWVTWR